MYLKELLPAINPQEIIGEPPEEQITGLSADSRKIRPGMIFAAISGQQHDGHAFLEAARQAGAVAALVEKSCPPSAGLCLLKTLDSRRALARAAHEFHGRPSQDLLVLGVTGTNGKTTVSYLLESILATQGSVGVMGTVETRFPGWRKPSDLTTPDAVAIQEFLHLLKEKEVKQLVMEVSSHALEQARVESVLYDLGVFTNLSRDHLDYHFTLENYYQAKRRLFIDLLAASAKAGKQPRAVVNLDNDWGKRLAGECRQAGLRTWTYGLDSLAQVRAEDVSLSLEGISFRLLSSLGDFWVTSSLLGSHNLQNLLAAAAAGLALNIPLDQVALGLMALTGVPGRLERVSGPSGSPTVLVDYAHTDDALRHVLTSLRGLTWGRLFCVFGAGGDRDQGKRPLMGQAAGELADVAVLTSDNPRRENPESIMDMVEAGLREAGSVPLDMRASSQVRGYVRLADRQQAIAWAAQQANRQDVVLIAGKGHESYQIIGTEKRCFDDRQAALAALERRVMDAGHV